MRAISKGMKPGKLTQPKPFSYPRPIGRLFGGLPACDAGLLWDRAGWSAPIYEIGVRLAPSCVMQSVAFVWELVVITTIHAFCEHRK